MLFFPSGKWVVYLSVLSKEPCVFFKKWLKSLFITSHLFHTIFHPNLLIKLVLKPNNFGNSKTTCLGLKSPKNKRQNFLIDGPRTKSCLERFLPSQFGQCKSIEDTEISPWINQLMQNSRWPGSWGTLLMQKISLNSSFRKVILFA